MSLPALYSFRRCPYAMRARSAIIASGKRVQLREVVLRDKPAAMLESSPKGSVPVLVLPDGKVVDESWDIMLWALRMNDPQFWLGKDECHVPGASTLVQENDSSFKLHLDRYKYPERFPKHTQSEHRAAGEQFLQQLEQRLGTSQYLMCDAFTLADAALLPFVRQFAAVDVAWFAAAPYPALRAWLARYTASELFIRMMEKFAAWKPGDAPVIFGG